MSDPNPNPNPDPNPPADIITMKQGELDALVSSRISAALAAASKKQPVVPDTIQKELDELRAKEKERERADLERRGEYTKALESQATSIKAEYEPLIKDRDDKLAKGSSKLREVIVTNALLSAAADGNAVAPSQVVKLLEHRVKLSDDMQPVVYDDNGNPAFAVGGTAMTPAQLMEAFLRENPHFVKAAPGKSQDAKGGPGAKGAGSDGEFADLKKKVDDLATEVLRTGDFNLVAAHAKAVAELNKAKARG